MQSTDLIIIGGGIMGLATAYAFAGRHPGKAALILEKETEPGCHQTGHNSGVLHSGIYYSPGSLKAAHCREGKKALENFCTSEGIDFKTCGKVIVAAQAGELPGLHALYARGRAGGVRCELISPSRLQELEPHAAGIEAIHIPDAGVVDFRQVCRRLKERLEEAGVPLLLGARVTALTETARGVVVESTRGDFSAQYVVNCAGLQADRVASWVSRPSPVKIVPFRGEYFRLRPPARRLCRALIYPVPDPRFPFLGVHFSRTVAEAVTCGPNAVLALAREGYEKWSLDLKDLSETLTYPGFLRLAARFWRTGLEEIWRSLSIEAFVRSLQRLVPEVSRDDLLPAPAGVRAQAVTPEGTILNDFAFLETPRIINLLNAPSPAATASLSLGKAVAAKLTRRLGAPSRSTT